jgi:hypothetical protein
MSTLLKYHRNGVTSHLPHKFSNATKKVRNKPRKIGNSDRQLNHKITSKITKAEKTYRTTPLFTPYPSWIHQPLRRATQKNKSPIQAQNFILPFQGRSAKTDDMKGARRAI